MLSVFKFLISMRIYLQTFWYLFMLWLRHQSVAGFKFCFRSLLPFIPEFECRFRILYLFAERQIHRLLMCRFQVLSRAASHPSSPLLCKQRFTMGRHRLCSRPPKRERICPCLYNVSRRFFYRTSPLWCVAC